MGRGKIPFSFFRPITPRSRCALVPVPLSRFSFVSSSRVSPACSPHVPRSIWGKAVPAPSLKVQMKYQDSKNTDPKVLLKGLMVSDEVIWPFLNFNFSHFTSQINLLFVEKGNLIERWREESEKLFVIL